MKTILVTGANGQLGSELRYLNPAYKHLNFVFTDVNELDITREEKLDAFLSVLKPDFFINAAAYTAVDKAESDAENARLLNGFAPGFIGKLSKRYSYKIIHVSTDYIFDGKSSVPYKESDPVNPASVYGKTKLEGEHELLKYNADAIILRTAWLYSVYGNNFVKTMIRLGRERDQVSVVNDQIGSPTNAADLAEVILNIIGQKWVPGIYHYSNEGICSWYEFAREIHQMAGISCALKPITTAEYPTAATRPSYSLLDKSKIQSTYNVIIPHWKDSLEKCINRLLPAM